MGRMTRTQISLEERQYQFVRRQAAEQGSSMGAYLRSLIDEAMAKERPRSSIMDLAGIFGDGGLTNAEIDEILADEAEHGTTSPERDEPAKGRAAGSQDEAES